MISANVGVLLKETFFILVLNILTHCLAVNIHMEDTFIQNFKIYKKLIQNTRNRLIPNNAYSNYIYIFQEKVNKMCVH